MPLWLLKYWKHILIGGALTAIIVGVGLLYSAYKIEKARRISLQYNLEVVIKQKNVCLSENRDWKRASETWNETVDQYESEAASQAERLRIARNRLSAAREELSSRETGVDTEVRSEGCSEAVTELIGVLGWGGEE